MSYRPGFAFYSAGALGCSPLHTGKRQKPQRCSQCEKRDSSPIGVRGIKRTEPRPTAKLHPHHKPYPINTTRQANVDLTFLTHELKTSPADTLPRLRPILSIFHLASPCIPRVSSHAQSRPLPYRDAGLESRREVAGGDRTVFSFLVAGKVFARRDHRWSPRSLSRYIPPRLAAECTASLG